MTEEPRHPHAEAPATHWERVYTERGAQDLSWYEERPETSTRLVLADGVPASVIDVGAGSTLLPDTLLEAGVSHVTLLDLSMRALALTSARLHERANRVTTIVADVLTYRFDEQYDVWHDRAVLHFLTEPAQQAAYVEQVRRVVPVGGRVVIGAFAPDGPESSSGLPVLRFDTEGLVALFGPGFGLERTQRAEHHTPWDSVQPFTWVVLRRTDRH